MKKRMAAIVLGAALMFVVGICIGLQLYAKKVVADEIRRVVEETPWIEGVEYETLRVELLVPAIRLRHISIGLLFPGAAQGPARIEIEQAHLDGFKLKAGFPDRLRISVKGLRAASIQGLPRPVSAALDAMVYGSVEADFECAHAYNREKRELVVDGPRITAKDMGELSASFRLANIDPNRLFYDVHDKGAMLMAMAGASLAGGKIRYKDDSLAGRLWKTEAKEWLRVVRRTAREAIRDMDRGVQRGKNPSTRRAWREMAEFLENPGEICIEAAPESPLPFLGFLWIKTPDELMDRLGVSMETRKGSELK